ncbi:transporter [Phenylobacterium sp.]|uniref:transporter n=1 Tax=Phenylobacterium sp. TaxID=1871053 RepID=UPI00120BF01A|nr:transporter [Phenylobacterium sp.]THD60608.1 MAG: hypothetical protein E8A49_14385 [Phenylobacterium sp.]
MTCGAIAAAPACAEAPPFVATDTDIADALELATFVSVAARHDAGFSTLGFDLAVPLASAWELTLVPRFAETRHGDQHASGFGDTEVAVKYLALTEADGRPAVAFEPNLTFPTGGRRLAKDASRSSFRYWSARGSVPGECRGRSALSGWASRSRREKGRTSAVSPGTG